MNPCATNCQSEISGSLHDAFIADASPSEHSDPGRDSKDGQGENTGVDTPVIAERAGVDTPDSLQPEGGNGPGAEPDAEAAEEPELRYRSMWDEEVRCSSHSSVAVCKLS